LRLVCLLAAHHNRGRLRRIRPRRSFAVSDSVEKLIVGCGYLGRRVALEWLRQERAVAALTRSPENARELERLGMGAILGDVTNPASLAELPAAGTLLYAVGFDRTAGHARRTVSVNGLESVLRALAPRICRLVYVSSTSVYGQSAGEWVDETSPTEPVQARGQVSLEAERVVRQCVPQAVVLRLAGIYGPGRLLRRIEEVRSGASIAGNPDAWLNLIHVDDAVTAVLAAEEHGSPGATYVVCDDGPLRRREYYELLSRAVGAPPPTFAENASVTRGQASDLNKRCSNRRLRAELNVTLRFPTAVEGLGHAVAAHAD
jgi:nucleoside-diphosphate-sugar epimerase